MSVVKLLSTNTSLLVDGISYGMVLFLISVGLTVTLGVMRVANLAHCGFAMIGGYAAYALMARAGFDFIVALPVATLLVVCSGSCWSAHCIAGSMRPRNSAKS